jgi:hypothetical protein
METWLLKTAQSPEIISVVLTALLAGIARFLQPSTKLLWGASHGFTFLLPPQGTPPGNPTPLETGTVFIQNMGRKPAENIEVVLNFRPQHFQIWPALNYEAILAAENHFVIKIENLGPREHTTLEMLSANANLPATLRVRSPLGDAKKVPFAPMRVMPTWFNRGVVLLLLFGLLATIYLVILFIKFVAGI